MRTWLGLTAATLMAAGCATTGYQRAEKTVKSIEATRAELAAGQDLIAETLVALDQLYGAGGGDLRPLHAQLGRHIRMLEQQAVAARRRAEAYRQNANAYVGAWADELAQIANPEIRDVSKARRGETIRNFGAIENAAAKAREAYQPLLEDLRGIHQFLGQDLTARGVSASAGQVAEARKEAAALQQRIDDLIAELDRVSREMTPSTGG